MDVSTTLPLRPADNNFNLLRIIAASAVIVSHGIELPSGLARRDAVFAATGYTLSWYAVSFFFIISGFLVTASWVRRPRLGAFLFNRVLRIWPGLIVMVAVTVGLLGLLFAGGSLLQFLSDRQTLAYALGAVLVFPVRYALPGIFETTPLSTVNGSLWTLRFEVTCYVLLAAAGTCGLLRDGRLRLATLAAGLAAAASLVVGLAIVGAPRQGVLSLLPELGRLGFCFLLGALYNDLRARLPLRLPVAAVLVLLSVLVHGTPLFVPVVSVALAYGAFWVAFVPQGRAMRGLRTAPDYSYGLYIYAFPVQQALVALWPDMPAAGVVIYGVLATLPFAALSWHLVEKPCLSLRRLARNPGAAAPSAVKVAVHGS